jgi:beta-galactosidase
LRPVGKPARIELTPDLTSLKDGGRQVSTVEVHVVDEDGSRVSNATHSLTFELSGSGRLQAAGNAGLTNSKELKFYQGRAVAIVRSGAKPGKVTLRVTAEGLPVAELGLSVVE